MVCCTSETRVRKMQAFTFPFLDENGVRIFALCFRQPYLFWQELQIEIGLRKTLSAH